MLEVNAQWHVQDPASMVGSTQVSFVNEAERIAMHLHLVQQRLTTHVPQGLSARQLDRRSFLLCKLGNYADRGRFPQNYVLPYRNPVFIDPHGTACAVGQLMIESGHHALADRISAEMNLGYVLDMPWPAIAAWGREHGFTPEELAWIQPGYPPNLPWTSLGGGTNGTVTVTKTLNNGDVLICGEFTEAGGVAANNVAIWNGSGYEALGAGMTGAIRCAVEYDGELYVGGSFLNGPNDLAKWNGSIWSFNTVFMGKSPNMNALHVHDGTLYAAGDIVGFAGVDPLVQRMDGAYWTPVGSYFDGSVLTLATHDGMLVAGGAFTTTTGPTTPAVSHVGYFNGTDWQQLGEGLNAPVRDLLDVNGTLYAGGDLFENIAVTFGMARIAADSSDWEDLLPNHANYMYAGVGPTWISSLVEHAGSIYFGGNFYISPLIGTYGSNLGRFHGNPDEVTAMIVLEAEVNDVTMQGNVLIIGGAFEALYPHLASLDVNTGINDGSNARTTFRVGPNPSTDVLTAQLPEQFGANTTFRIIDASGRSIAANAVRAGASVQVDIKTLSAGSYVIEAAIGDAVTTARFVKE